MIRKRTDFFVKLCATCSTSLWDPKLLLPKLKQGMYKQGVGTDQTRTWSSLSREHPDISRTSGGSLSWYAKSRDYAISSLFAIMTCAAPLPYPAQTSFFSKLLTGLLAHVDLNAFGVLFALLSLRSCLFYRMPVQSRMGASPTK